MIDLAVFQKPVVYIRIIQFFVSLPAFVCVVAFQVCFTLVITCLKKEDGSEPMITNASQQICITYPFSLADIPVLDYCSESFVPVYLFHVDFDMSAEFFVAIGVISFLYSFFTIIFYWRFWEKYEYSTFFPVPDLMITFALASMWFSSSCSWASAVTSLQQYISPKTMQDRTRGLLSCQDSRSADITKDSCRVTPASWSYGPLIFATVCGFASIVLWMLNSFLLFRKLKAVKAEEQRRADAIASSIDYQQGRRPNPAAQYGTNNINPQMF